MRFFRDERSSGRSKLRFADLRIAEEQFSMAKCDLVTIKIWALQGISTEDELAKAQEKYNQAEIYYNNVNRNYM